MGKQSHGRRPILSKSVVASLDALARSTPATDETEAALRYVRALVAYERHPATLARRKELSARVQAAKANARGRADA